MGGVDTELFLEGISRRAKKQILIPPSDMIDMK
jgi:hypothetical protein